MRLKERHFLITSSRRMKLGCGIMIPKQKRSHPCGRHPTPLHRRKPESISRAVNTFVFFMDRRGMLLIHQVPEEKTINAAYYSNVNRFFIVIIDNYNYILCYQNICLIQCFLHCRCVTKKCLFSKVGILLVYFQLLSRDLMYALRKKRPYVNPEDIILHQDNAPPHTASTTQLEIDVLGFQRLAHLPYSPDLAPIDFRVFPEVKSQLRGIHFNSANELMLKTQGIISSFDSQWYRDTYDKWVTRYRKCTRTGGDYTEKV